MLNLNLNTTSSGRGAGGGPTPWAGPLAVAQKFVAFYSADYSSELIDLSGNGTTASFLTGGSGGSSSHTHNGSSTAPAWEFRTADNAVQQDYIRINAANPGSIDAGDFYGMLMIWKNNESSDGTQLMNWTGADTVGSDMNLFKNRLDQEMYGRNREAGAQILTTSNNSIGTTNFNMWSYIRNSSYDNALYQKATFDANSAGVRSFDITGATLNVGNAGANANQSNSFDLAAFGWFFDPTSATELTATDLNALLTYYADNFSYPGI